MAHAADWVTREVKAVIREKLAKEGWQSLEPPAQWGLLVEEACEVLEACQANELVDDIIKDSAKEKKDQITFLYRLEERRSAATCSGIRRVSFATMRSL